MGCKIIAIDFDNTLFETEYPTILRPILPVIQMAKHERKHGAKLILWTCREGPELDAAVEACRAEGLEFDAVNDNLPEEKAKWGNNPRKVAATEYWDDRNGWFSLYRDERHGIWFTVDMNDLVATSCRHLVTPKRLNEIAGWKNDTV